MNFTITRQNLHNGLAAVSASIPSKTTLPVLSNILFDAKEDGVWMSGTDLDVAVRVKALAEVKEAGTLTAPGKKLQLFALVADLYLVVPLAEIGRQHVQVYAPCLELQSDAVRLIRRDHGHPTNR